MSRSVVNLYFYLRLLASSVKNESGFVRSFTSKSEEEITAASLSCENEWESFKAKYNKVYADEREEALRKTIFLDNLKKIKAHNEKAEPGEHAFRMEVNKFADLTNDEFKAIYCRYKKTHNSARLVHKINLTVKVPASTRPSPGLILFPPLKETK